MIKLIYGDDNFRINKAVEKEAQNMKIAPIVFDGTLASLLIEIKSQNFFGGDRLFVIKDKLEKVSDTDLTVLKEIMEQINNEGLIFIEIKEPPKKIIELIKTKGEIISFGDLKGAELINFIKAKVAEQKGDIAPLAAERLAGYVGSDLWQLEEEIKKLVLYKKETTEPIQTADVDLLVHANFEANIFNLVDAIGNKNSKKANQLVNDFLVNGENPIYILTMITRQIRNIAIAKLERGLTENDFAKRMGVHPFVAKKTVAQAKNFTPGEIKELYKKLVWADLRLKSGYEPSQILEMLVV